MLIVGTVLLLAAVAALAVALGLFDPQTSVADVARAIRLQGRGNGALVESEKESLGRLRALTVPFLVEKAQRNLVLLGRKAGWTLRRLMLTKIIAATVLGLAGFSFFSSSPSGRSFVVFLLLVAAGFFYPDIWLDSRAKERQTRLQKELPDVLDQVVIATEAGMSFEGALDRVARTGRGEMAEEFARTLQDMRLGMSRREAYGALADRTTVEELQRFCKQVVQGEEFGVSMATVVRNLAQELRVKRKWRAEEIAQKIPVKIISPLAVCFLPVLFVVVLYPSLAGLGGTL